MATAKKTKRELTRLTVLERRLRQKTIIASSFLSDHSNIIIHVQKVSSLMIFIITFVNPEISCIRMGSGPALFGLARFYCTCKFLKIDQYETERQREERLNEIIRKPLLAKFADPKVDALIG